MKNLAGMMIFAQVVQSGSFSQAADALGMSKSSVSKKVSFLEDRLGVRLLNRTTRKLSLTEVGRIFYERCERIMTEAEEAELAITHLQDEPRGHLRISAPMSFGIDHLGGPIAEFMAMYPDLSIDVSLNDRFVDIVEEGFDLAIRIGRLSDSSLIAKKIAESRLIVTASPDYWAENGTPKHPKDLADHRCIRYTLSRNSGNWFFKEEGQPLTVQIEGQIQVNNGDVARELAVAGAGITSAPAFILGCSVQRGLLVPALVEYEDDPLNVYAVYPHNRHLSAKVRVFVDFLKSKFGHNPPWEGSL